MSEDLIEDTSLLSDDDEEPITAQKVGVFPFFSFIKCANSGFDNLKSFRCWKIYKTHG